MEEADIIKKLENVDLSDIVPPNHQRQLGEALRRSGCFNESIIMALLKRTSPVILTVTVAVIAAAVVIGIKLSTPASAQETAQVSYTSLQDRLQQAQSASDLTRLTSEEYLSQDPKIAGFKPSRGNGKTLAELKLTYLKYTTSFGETCILGVDNNTGLPVLAIEKRTLSSIGRVGGGGASGFSNGRVGTAPVQDNQNQESFAGLPPAAQATLQAARDFSRLSLEEVLKQALSAKDLTRLTSDQYLRQNPNLAAYQPARGNGKTLAELKLNYLKFTTSFGGTCIVGIDSQTGLPVMARGGGSGYVGRAGGAGGGSGNTNGR